MLGARLLKRTWTNPKFREKLKATRRIYSRKRLQVKRGVTAHALGGWGGVICGNADRDALAFDHIHRGGTWGRDAHGGYRQMLDYHLTMADEAAQKLEVLCRDGNWMKHRAKAGRRHLA